ncbi:MAG TPA: glycosyltransferase [Ferruginibacter sp.]|nr:glycosyltransferase [Ferruginibacter sp.]HMP20530.1 glycosyltransferase [Ferruginibacter sp.]
MSEPITILLPVYNDTASLQMLLKDVQQLDAAILSRISMVVVNDGSASFKLDAVGNTPLTIVHLSRNLGHQKAIAIGLSYIKENMPGATVIVMDGDGEDRVADIPQLLQANAREPNTVFFAARQRRTNGLFFKLFYWLYKFSFWLSTGKKISFGNYSVLSYNTLCRAVYYSEIWNNYPGGIMKSGLPYKALPTQRGSRYAGKSKMNFTALLLHGFGAISVFLEVIITRIAIISFLMILVSALSIAAILIIRTTTSLAIPGWASIVGTSMVIILLISFIISLIAIFIYLSTQSQRKFIPALHYRDYILQTETR